MIKVQDFDTSTRLTATVTDNTRLQSSDPHEDIRHIIFKLPDVNWSYTEGQSIGVLPPLPPGAGDDDHLRLYAIANSRYGERHDKSLMSICVRRCHYADKASGETVQGIASNFLCDLAPGDTFTFCGPFTSGLSLPEDSADNLLMISIGTGIAPFRALLDYVYKKHGFWDGSINLYTGDQCGIDNLFSKLNNRHLVSFSSQAYFEHFLSATKNGSTDCQKPPQACDIEKNGREIWDLIQDEKTWVYIAGVGKIRKNLRDLMKTIVTEDEWTARKESMAQASRWQEIIY